MNEDKLNKLKELVVTNIEISEKLEVLLGFMREEASGQMPYATWISLLEEQTGSIKKNLAELSNELFAE